jgi:hypothetical protein
MAVDGESVRGGSGWGSGGVVVVVMRYVHEHVGCEIWDMEGRRRGGRLDG